MPRSAQLWTRTDAEFATSSEIVAMVERLADDPALAGVPAVLRAPLVAGLVVAVRGKLARFHPDGDLTRVSPMKLETYAGWCGTPLAFGLAFLDAFRTDEGQHADWHRIFGAQAKRREYENDYKGGRRPPQSVGAILSGNDNGNRSGFPRGNDGGNGSGNHAGIPVDSVSCQESSTTTTGDSDTSGFPRGNRGPLASRLNVAERERAEQARRDAYEVRATDWIRRFRERHPGDYAEYLQHAEAEADKIPELPPALRERTVQGLVRQRLEARGFASYETWCAQREREVAIAAD